MTSPLVIAVDCSTTAAKAIVVDPTGQVLASGSHALATRSPAPHRFEQHAPDWWSATDSAIRQALDELDDRSAVAAVCVTHQRESFVCLDERRPGHAAGDPVDGRPRRARGQALR